MSREYYEQLTRDLRKRSEDVNISIEVRQDMQNGAEAILELLEAKNQDDMPTVDAEPIVHGHWVSVKDRLPEANQLVLGFTGTGYSLALHNGNNRWQLDYYEYAKTVSNVFTHWMPLPKPPKMDEVVPNE